MKTSHTGFLRHGRARLLAGLAATCMVAVLGACGSDEPSSAVAVENACGDSSSAQYQELVKQAKDGGVLNLSWGEGHLGGTKGTNRLVDEFKEACGLPDLDVRFTVGGSPNELVAQILDEQKAGRKAVTDVFPGYPAHTSQLMKADALEAVNWRDWAPGISEEIVGSGGFTVAHETGVPGVAYNKERVPDPPKTLEELLDAKYKGRIATTASAASWDYLGDPNLWGVDRTTSYMEKFATQVGGLFDCSQLGNVLLERGFDFFALTCAQDDAVSLAEEGVPVGYLIPEDAAILVQISLGIPKNASNPAAAKLFASYVAGPAGQKTMWEVQGANQYLLPGSETRKWYDEVVSSSPVKPTELTVDHILESGFLTPDFKKGLQTLVQKPHA